MKERKGERERWHRWIDTLIQRERKIKRIATCHFDLAVWLANTRKRAISTHA